VIRKEDIKTFLEGMGAAAVGFGRVPDEVEVLEVNRRFPRCVVFGYRLSDEVLDSINARPTLIYKHHYKTVNWLLDQAAFHLVSRIEESGCKALAIPASQIVDWPSQKGHVPHKKLALEAGLGWIGRSGLLVHPQHGSRMRYVSVLTDWDFEPDKKLERDCGDCAECVALCPARAISMDGVDLKACLQKLREFASLPGIGQFICGVCVKACDGKD
jgi:epoxyqueuosine reductase QueG